MSLLGNDTQKHLPSLPRTRAASAQEKDRAGGSTATLPSKVSDRSLDVEALKKLPTDQVIQEYFPKMFVEIQSMSRSLSVLTEMRKDLDEMNLKIEELEREKKEQKKRIEDLTNRVDELEMWRDGKNEDDLARDREMINLQDNCNARERHSRSFNVRIVNSIPETINENTQVVVENILQKTGIAFDHNVEISIAHRTGPRPINPKHGRPIIVGLVRKSDVRYLLTKRNAFRQNGFLLFPDMTEKDRKEKAKYQAAINALYNEGVKSKFENGRWITDKKPFCVKNYPHLSHLINEDK